MTADVLAPALSLLAAAVCGLSWWLGRRAGRDAGYLAGHGDGDRAGYLRGLHEHPPGCALREGPVPATVQVAPGDLLRAAREIERPRQPLPSGRDDQTKTLSATKADLMAAGEDLQRAAKSYPKSHPAPPRPGAPPANPPARKAPWSSLRELPTKDDIEK